MILCFYGEFTPQSRLVWIWFDSYSTHFDLILCSLIYCVQFVFCGKAMSCSSWLAQMINNSTLGVEIITLSPQWTNNHWSVDRILCKIQYTVIYFSVYLCCWCFLLLSIDSKVVHGCYWWRFHYWRKLLQLINLWWQGLVVWLIVMIMSPVLYNSRLKVIINILACKLCKCIEI